MKLPQHPELRGDVIVRQVEGDFVVYDPVTDRTALLNPSAAVLLGLCDGSRTIEEIATTLAEAYEETYDDIVRDLETSLLELQAQGLLKAIPL